MSAIRSDIVLARVHDVIGPNAAIIDNTSNIFRPNDLPASLTLPKARRASPPGSRKRSAPAKRPRAAAYSLLLSLSSHALSAMRELIGMPERVIYAAQHHGGRFLTAAFDYGHFTCHFEAGVDRIPHFDAHLEVYTPDRDHPRRLRHALCPPPAGADDADWARRREPASPSAPCSRRGTTPSSPSGAPSTGTSPRADGRRRHSRTRATTWCSRATSRC